MTRFLLVSRGTVGNCCSPFLLNNANFTSILLEVFYKLDFETLSISEWNTYNIITTEDLASRAPKPKTTSSSGGGWVLPGGIDPSSGEIVEIKPTPTPEPKPPPPPLPPPTPTPTPSSGPSPTPSPPPPPPPTAPGPTCPPGQKLYKVSGTSGEVYVYAPATASKDEIQKLSGQTGFVTTVLSPEAFGGAYTYSREVTTAGGQRVTVPYSPEMEATRETVQIYGPIPVSGAPEEARAYFKEREAEIEAGMKAGTYVSPLATPHPYIQAQAETYGIPYRSAEMEAKRAAEYVGAAIEGDKCGPWGITSGEIQAALAYYESRGRDDMAGYLSSRYVSQGFNLEKQLERAEGVDLHGVFEDLAPYRTGVQYNLPVAYSEGAVSEEGLKLMGFSPGVVTGTIAAGVAIKSLRSSEYYDLSTGKVDLTSVIATGVLTESQARLLFSNKDVDLALSQAVDYQEMFPHGVGEEVIVGPPTTEESRGFLGRIIHPESWLGQKIWGPTDPSIPTLEIQASLRAEYEAYKAMPFMQQQLQYPFGGPGYDKGMGLYLPSPVGGFGPVVAPVGAVPAALASRAIPLTRVVTKLGLGGVITSTTWAGIEGALTPSKEFTWEQTKQQMYQDYLKSPELAAAIEAGKDRGEDLRAPTYEEYGSALGVKHEPLAYREGIAGVFGRGWEKQSEYLAAIAGDTPWYHPRSLVSGFTGYVLSPALAAQAQPYIGPKAALIGIPHFGPTAIQPFIVPGTPTWQKVLGVGLAALPYAIGPIGTTVSRVGKVTSRIPVIGTVQRGAGAVTRGVGKTADILTFGVPKATIATVERWMPWQFAYSTSGMIGKVLPTTSKLWAAGKTWGWWERPQPVPVREVWRRWGEESTGPGPAIEKVTPEYLRAQEARAYNAALEAEVAAGRMTKIVDPATGKVFYKTYGQEYLPGFGPEGVAISTPKPIPESPFTGRASYYYRTQVEPWTTEPAPAVPLAGQYYLPGWGPGAVKVATPPTTVPSAEWYSPYAQVITHAAPVVEVPGVSQTFFQQLAGTFRKVAPVVRVAAPSLATIGAMAFLPVSPIAATPLMSPIQVDMSTVDNLLQSGAINPQQHTQLTAAIQEAGVTSVTQQQVQRQIQQTIQETLTREQQREYQQQRQEQQQYTEQATSIEQLQQQWQQQYQQQQQQQYQQQQWEQQWQQEWTTQPDPFEDYTKPPEEPLEEIPPPIVPWLPGGAGVAAYRAGSARGMKKLLRGGQWIMPGLILHMPDPFGTGRQKIQLTKRRVRKYGAREPRVVSGGLRV